MATKVIVGDKTIVKKVVVGVPQSQNIAAQGLIATLGDVDGTVNRSNGVLLRYDSDAAKWKHIQLKTALAQNISITNVPNVGGTLAFDSNAGGVFTFTGPTPTQIRQHYSAFSQNNDLTYDSTTGKFSFNDSDFARTDRRDIYHRGLKLPTAQHISFKDSSTTIKESGGDFEFRNKSGNINILPNDGQSLVVKSDSDGSLIIQASDVGGVQLYHTSGKERFTTTDSGVRVKGDFIVDSDAVVNGTLYVKQATTLNSTLTVEDSAHIKDGLTVDSDLKVKGNIIVDGTLTSSITPANVREHFSAGGDLTYDSSTGKFSFDVEAVYTKANFDSDLGLANTGQLPEGSNLYFTTARARQSVSVTDNGGDGSLSYDSGTGVISYTGPSAEEARLHISVNDVGGDGSLSYDNTSGVITYTGPSAAEVRAHFSAGASLTYDASTGQFTTNQALDSNSNVTFNQVRGPAEFIIDPAAVGDNTGTVKILGNLQVEGTQTTLNSTAVTINDKNIVIADSAADSSALHGGGITFGGANIGNKPTFSYSHADKRFQFNRNIQADSFIGDVTGNVTGNLTGNVTGQVSDISNHTTSDLAEGSNLYYTDTRARNAVSAVDSGGDGAFSYVAATGKFKYRGPSASEVRAHFSAGGDLTYDSTTGKFQFDVESVYTKANFDSDLGLANTGQLPEGSNLYYTTARADSAFDVRLATKSTSDLAEGSNQYYTEARVNTVFGKRTTDSLSEGSTNLYFTNERAQDALSSSFVHSNHTNITATYDDPSGEIRIAAAQQFNDSDARHAITVADSGGFGHLNYNQDAGLIQYKGVTSTEIRSQFSATGTGFQYDSATGKFTLTPAATYNKAKFDSDFNLTSTDSLSEGSSNLYFTEPRVNTVFGKRTTDSLSEGTTNKYYTDTRARNALTVIDSGGDGRLTYTASTGRLVYKGQNDSEFFQHLEDNGSSLGELTYDSSNKFRVTSAFFTGKPTAGTLSTDSDKILILDATDGALKQAGVQQLATAAAGVGNTAKLLAFIGL
tara:strand:- start:6622 stop:9681 length:3060 start_codon:yes stop_codon:yes gene_type:complete